MRIDSSGNVGIGTSSPDYALRVNKGASSGNTPQMRLTFSDNNNGGALLLGNDPTGVQIGVKLWSDGGGLYFNNANQGGGADYIWQVYGTERMRLDLNGNLIQSAPTTPPSLATNGQMVFNLTSNTNLRVSVRGSDGVTRTANITLA
jgi:hypothetical protein